MTTFAAAEEWLASASWTDELDAAFAGLDARARLGHGEGTFEDRWPATEIVDGWLRAAFVDVALSCRDDREPRLREPHARALVTQTRRGFGWGDAKLRGPVRARAALAAALVSAWDLTATALGGRPLANAVTPKKIPATLEALVRHVATAAKHGLGEASCGRALAAYLESASFEPAIFWTLARLAIAVAGNHPPAEVAERCGALVRGDVAAPASAARRSAVDDPRVSVFERYMHLWDDAGARAAIARDQDYVVTGGRRGWDTHTASWVARAWILGCDEAIAAARPTLERLDPIASTSTPSPGATFRAMLGLPAPDAATVQKSLQPYHRARELGVLRRYRWSTAAAAVALAAGDTALVKLLTPGTKNDRFRPGKTFGDDPRAVLRYVALAVEANAARADVAAALVELLVARPPDDHDSARPGGAWRWESLLCLAYVHFHRLGGARPEDVPRLLRAMLRGEPT
jgi:hypothetical protein